MHILCLSCDDKPGIVAAVAGALRDHDCNIEESGQFNDHCSGKFFMRVVFNPKNKKSLSDFQNTFETIVDQFFMVWNICNTEEKTKTIVMVSKFDHCLNDVLYKWRTGALPIEITGVISNHKEVKDLVKHHGLPFHYCPVTPNTKDKQEQDVRKIIEKTQSELIVMARYMQILTEKFCKEYAGRVINIHHSFLPGFKGAKPYHQAYERGVKIIGATAHFATHNLDEGPIITQDVAPVTNTDTPEKMELMGRDIEANVLARAVKLYGERRIFLHDQRTVIL